MQPPGPATYGGAEISQTQGIRDDWPPRRVVTPQTAGMLAARRNRGWSLRRAAREIGCSFGTVAHLEKGRRAPSLTTAYAIIDAYGLGHRQAQQLLDDAVDDAGKSSPYKSDPSLVHRGSR